MAQPVDRKAMLEHLVKQHEEELAGHLKVVHNDAHADGILRGTRYAAKVKAELAILRAALNAA